MDIRESPPIITHRRRKVAGTGSAFKVHEELYTTERAMVAMRGHIIIVSAAGALLAAAPALVGAVPQAENDPLEARLWLDRGDEPVVQRGERVGVYYRSTEDAFVAILNIDTDGTTRLVFPRSPTENHYVRAGRDYRLIFPNSSYWRVEDRPGVGYFFILTSREPFDFSSLRFSRFGGGWDMSFVGQQVYTDPYVAVDDLVSHLIPDWEYADYALDFATYHVEQRQQYPRFLCYECHGFRPYTVWNPYAYSCTSFRVVIYDDPYYYPSSRYRGNRVVYSRPTAVGIPRYEFNERAVGEAGTPDVRTRATSGRTVEPRQRSRRDPPPTERTRPQPNGGSARQRSGSGTAGRRTSAPQAVPTTRSGRAVPRTSGSRATSSSRPSRTEPTRARQTQRVPSRAPTNPSVSRRPTARLRPPATGSRARTRGATSPTTRRQAPAQTTRPPARSSARPTATARPPSRSSGARATTAPRRPPARKPPARASSSRRSVRKPVKRPPRGGSG